MPTRGIGGRPINYNQLSDAELDELANYKPTLTYGQAKQAPPSAFIPAHVVWDKKVIIHMIKQLEKILPEHFKFNTLNF